jgi:hypothetical protein
VEHPKTPEYPDFTRFSGRHSMAARKTPAARKKVPARKRPRVKEVVSKPARVPSRGSATDDGASTRPRRIAPEWKGLVEVAVAIEVLCDEVQRAYEMWPEKRLRTADGRTRCREHMLMLGQITSDVSGNYRSLVRSLGSSPAATPKAVAATAALDKCETFGVGLLLEQLQARLDRMARLMAEPYSRAVQERIDLDFSELAKLRVALSTIAKVVIGEASSVASGTGVPLRVRQALELVCTRSKALLLDTSEGQRDDKEIVKMFEQRLSGYTSCLESLAGEYKVLREAVWDVLQEAPSHVLGKPGLKVHNDLTLLLEKVDHAREFSASVLSLAKLAMNRAVSIDERLDTRARSLRAALKRAEAEHELLQKEIDHWRGVLARAPFRNRLRRRPLPEWEGLSAKEQQVVAALVRIREGDPDGPYFVTSQKMIEATMGLVQTSTTTWRLLRDLDGNYEIVGQRQQRGSRSTEAATNWYWIAEDAFQKYRLRWTPIVGQSGALFKV